MNYIEYMKQELIPAFGCTEPIALAYVAAKAREVMGKMPDKIVAKVSGNIIKNANSVVVPGTDGRRGLEISIVTGAFLGDASKELEVLSNIDKSKLNDIDRLIEAGIVDIELIPGVENLYIEIELYSEEENSKVIVEKDHTNIILIEKNNEVVFKKDSENQVQSKVDFSFKKIYDFAKSCNYDEITPILDMEIEYNQSIAEKGLEENWGSNIGSLIYSDATSFNEKLVAYAAAGSDARMDGCEKPVVINSGSGNQGITVSVPIIFYAKEYKVEKDKFYRALMFSNLISLYLKQNIGKLSAYCGVVSAAAASVIGIGFMEDRPVNVLEETLSNALVVNSGLLCDGAKPSCAMKIASSLRNAFLAYEQALSGNSFKSGDGIVKSTVDETIKTVGNIAKFGMRETDIVILNEIIEGNKRETS